MSTSFTPSDPPPYSISTTGFPQGYFLIRNLATRKVLDIERDEKGDGTEAILYPESEGSHVISFRDPSHDNQVFFVDYSGALCSKSSGHALDVESDGRIVLRHRRPVIPPFPNKFSHPLPQFNYTPKTCQITVSFPYDLSYPGNNQDPMQSRPSKTHLLTSIPMRKPRGLLDDASEFFQGAASAISSPFTLALGIRSEDPSTSASAAEVQRGEFDIRDEELLEADRVEDDSVDDSPEAIRRVRVISLGTEEGTVGPKTKERRRWEIIPLLKARAMTGTI